jgi:hypothetical protein
MQLSGHTTAQLAHPVHASGWAAMAPGYPFELTSLDSANTSNGHAATQTAHPLHRSTSMTTAPFIFAISGPLYYKFNAKIGTLIDKYHRIYIFLIQI